MVSEEHQTEESVIGLEQQLIMQYVLMRPWVTEKTIDMLSQLREPSKRNSTATVSPTTPTANGEEYEEKRSLSGFWPFRKSTTTNSTSDLVWSEEEEEDESPGSILNYRKLSFSARKSHHRSFSLPSKSLMEVTHV